MISVERHQGHKCICRIGVFICDWRRQWWTEYEAMLPTSCLSKIITCTRQIYKKSYLLPRMLKNVKCSYWLAGQSWSVEPLWHRRRNVEILNSFQISFRYLCVHLPVVFAWLDIIIFVHSHKTPRKIWHILFLIPGCRCHELELEKEMWSLNYVSLLSGKHICNRVSLRTQNRPFPSSLVPLFQNESKCETFHMQISFARSFIFMQIKVIFIRIVSHLDWLWNRGTRELGNGLFPSVIQELR